MSHNLNHFFSHIKIAQLNRISVIIHPHSKLILSILNVLQDCGYIRGYRLLINHNNNLYTHIEILLKYKNQKPVINHISSFSHFGHSYLSVRHLSHLFFPSSSPSLFFMKGIYILTTSKGIMTHLSAYNLNIGGKILCHVF
jgi:small subunit ribosomal protein S8